jgi:uncharacterized protein YegL
MLSTSELELAEFAENPGPFCPCILLLDVSRSMSGARINSLNAGLRSFKDSLTEDDLAKNRVQVAVVTFSGATSVIQDFVTASDYNPPTLLPEPGGTQMSSAILKAIEMIKERKDLYKSAGVEYYRPWIFLITDGEPTDGIDLFNQAAQVVKKGEADKAFAFFSVGVEDADLDQLKLLSLRPPVALKGLQFKTMFGWLSKSLSSVSSSQVGDKVALPSFESWGEV